jgi:DNA-binding NarL/FixJ family response regulator
MNEFRVMIADGDPGVVAALRLLLTRHPDFDVVGESTTIQDLLRQTADIRPDVIVLDCELRDLDIHAHVAQLRLLHGDVGIVALSTRDERRSQALAAGASAFVSKGESPPYLLETLRSLWRHRPGDSDTLVARRDDRPLRAAQTEYDVDPGRHLRHGVGTAWLS